MSTKDCLVIILVTLVLPAFDASILTIDCIDLAVWGLEISINYLFNDNQGES